MRVVAALERLQDTIHGDMSCVLILPDRGERSLATIYDDDWVREHFGDVAHLWQSAGGERECMTTAS